MAALSTRVYRVGGSKCITNLSASPSPSPPGIFPAALIARKVAPALTAGCSTIIHPSPQTPGVAMMLVDCCRAGTLPAGAVNLVIGPTEATYAPIMAAKAVCKVSLTGSTRVGQQMIRDAAATLKRVSIALGGTNHSGMGHEGGTEAIRGHLDIKSSQMVWA